jgi:hypothetical protein
MNTGQRGPFSPWGEGAPKGRMRGPSVAREVAPHQFGRMTYGRATKVAPVVGECHAAVSHGLTSSPPRGEGKARRSRFVEVRPC